MKFNITVTGTLILAYMITIMAFAIELTSYNKINVAAGVFILAVPVAAALAGGRKYLDTKFKKDE